MKTSYLKHCVLFFLFFCFTTHPMQKIDQELASKCIVGFKGTKKEDKHVKELCGLLEKKMLAGIVLFARNIKNPKQLKKLTSCFCRANDKAIIAVDQEGGFVQRLNKKKGFIGFDSPFAVTTKHSPEDAFPVYEKMARELAEHHVNFNFAPVVDLHDPDSAAIGKYGRSFSSDPERVVEYAKSFIKAHRKYKVRTSLKHFPGHGFAKKDSHFGVVDVTNSHRPEELVPFEELIKSGDAYSVMVAHLINKKLDENFPATLSPVIISAGLRKRGYEGVVVSDDFCMEAIRGQYELNDIGAKAVTAGCDLLVFSKPWEFFGEDDFSFAEFLQRASGTTH